MINSKCVPETNVSKTPYDLNINIDSTRKIRSAKCSCQAGSSGHCKHICALISFINEERESETCTEKTMAFQAPSRYGLDKYRKGLEIEKIFKFDEKSKRPEMSFFTSDSAKKYHAELMERAGNTSSLVYKLCKLRLKDEKPIENECFSEELKSKIFLSVGQTYPYEKILPKTVAEKEYYRTNIQMSNVKKFRTCCLTMNQSLSSVWKAERRKRVTATKAHKIVRALTERSRLNYFAEGKRLEGMFLTASNAQRS